MNHNNKKFSGNFDRDFGSCSSASSNYNETQTNHSPKEIMRAPSSLFRDRIKAKSISWFSFAFRKGLFWGTIFSLTAVTSASFGASLILFTPLSSTWLRQQQQDLRANYPLVKPVNIVLLDSQSLNNPIALLHFDSDRHYVQIQSITKDSEVNISGVGWVTLGDAIKAYNDPVSVSQFVSQSLNRLPVDGYIRLNDRSFDNSGDRSQLEQTQKLLELLRRHFQNPDNIIRLSQQNTTIKLKLDTNLNRDEIITLAIFLGSLEREELELSHEG
jgi:anionic cell wall polymer biosynthesis LytR-Cps2A-Psr (LCP) family protein